MRFRQQPRDPVDLNLTPLIDIIFLLLIFFMVTTTFHREQAIRLKLPEAESSQALKEQETIRLAIDSKGNYYFEGRKVEDLEKALVQLKRKKPRAYLIIAADRKAYHEHVVRALDVARRVGLKRIVFATEKRE